MSPIDPGVKDWLQAAAWLAAAIGALLTILKFWSEQRLSREQRERELRWRQAEAAKSLNDEMLTDPEAWAALQMIDSERRDFKLPSTAQVLIDHSDVQKALDPDHEPNDEKHRHIRDCFDSLFYYLAMLQHYKQTTLILSTDIEYPVDYYLSRLGDLRPVVDRYVERFRLQRTMRFLASYAKASK